MRVTIIPTGKLELLAVSDALRSRLPEIEFSSRPDLRGPDPRPFRSFTLSDLSLSTVQTNLENPGSSLSELVGALVNELHGPTAPDLALVLDDLELWNVAHPHLGRKLFADAVGRHVQRLRTRDPLAANHVAHLLRTRASLHFAVPMIEAWLFADPNGPYRAGVPRNRLPPILSAGQDPEDFETPDAAYISCTGAGCTGKPEWTKTGMKRERHPKRYMCWLCRDPTRSNCTTYDTAAGAAALKGLDWGQTLSNPAHMQNLRALIDDITGQPCSQATTLRNL